MNFKEVTERFFFYLSAPKCVGCKERLSYGDKALCPSCLSLYRENKKRNCSICSKTLEFCSCSNTHLENHYVKKLIKVYRYRPVDELPSNNLIYSLKRENRKDVLDFLSDELYQSILNSVPDASSCIFTNVPRRRRERARYGFDHAELLSKRLAKMFSAEYYQPIISKSKKPQKKTMGDERMKNASFKLKNGAKDLKGKQVIIVDDIVTTGASMGYCASLIRALGTKKIIGATIAIAYKDSYIQQSREDRFSAFK